MPTPKPAPDITISFEYTDAALVIKFSKPVDQLVVGKEMAKEIGRAIQRNAELVKT